MIYTVAENISVPPKTSFSTEWVFVGEGTHVQLGLFWDDTLHNIVIDYEWSHDGENKTAQESANNNPVAIKAKWLRLIITNPSRNDILTGVCADLQIIGGKK